jgi:hypothetical protein
MDYEEFFILLKHLGTGYNMHPHLATCMIALDIRGK